MLSCIEKLNKLSEEINQNIEKNINNIPKLDEKIKTYYNLFVFLICFLVLFDIILELLNHPEQKFILFMISQKFIFVVKSIIISWIFYILLVIINNIKNKFILRMKNKFLCKIDEKINNFKNIDDLQMYDDIISCYNKHLYSYSFKELFLHHL